MKTLLITCLFIVMFCTISQAYRKKSHINITNAAINNKQEELRNALNNANILGNINAILREDTGRASSPENPLIVRDFIQNGGYMEDEPTREGRFVRHFYDPVTNEGLNDLFWGDSSYIWANRADNVWSWQNARRSYLNGLTRSTEEERKPWLAAAFRSLGQVMHLVQDKAVPAHVRNDGHLDPDPYEVYIEANARTIESYTPVFYDGPLGSGSNAPLQLWDSNRYNGTDPNVTLTRSIGLAEYTNANFLSNDTLFSENNLNDWIPLNDKHYFPFPRRSDTTLFSEPTGASGNGYAIYRKYFEKTSGGVSVRHLATASRLYVPELEADPPPVVFGLDDQCHSDYAEKLIPRAVGYSAALLQYFFRGDISMTTASNNVGKQILRNNSDEAMIGAFFLYFDDTEGKRTTANTEGLTLTVPARSEIRIQNLLPPIDERETVEALLVFKGKLGNEEGAVTATTITLQQGPIGMKIDPDNEQMYLIENNYDKSIAGTVTLRYLASDGIIKEPEKASWPVELASGETVSVAPFTVPPDAAAAEQYQMVFQGTVNQEADSLISRIVTLPPIKPGWFEEWSKSLPGSHPWLTTDIDYEGSNYDDGATLNFVADGRLNKENIRYPGMKYGRVNETTIRVPFVSPSGQYCLNSYHTACVPYNFGAEFPLTITPDTVVRIKIDELSVSPALPRADSCSLTGYGQYQGIRLKFDNGISLSFTREGQEPPDEWQAYITPGVEYSFNIFQAFAEAGVPFVTPVHLTSLNVVQSLGTLCTPSTSEHRQRIKVDYIRLEEDPLYGWY